MELLKKFFFTINSTYEDEEEPSDEELRDFIEWEMIEKDSYECQKFFTSYEDQIKCARIFLEWLRKKRKGGHIGEITGDYYETKWDDRISNDSEEDAGLYGSDCSEDAWNEYREYEEEPECDALSQDAESPEEYEGDSEEENYQEEEEYQAYQEHVDVPDGDCRIV